MRSNRPLSAGRKTHTFKILGRLLSYLFHYYKWRMIAVFVCITVAAAAGIAMVLAFWCLVWPVAGAQAGPLAALVVGTAVAYAVVGLGMIFLIALGLTMIPGKP